jgi:hypothetical protein
MANPNKVAGFRPIKHLNGNPWNGSFNVYYKSASSDIFRGSPVILAGSADATGKYPTIDIGGAGAPFVGVAIAFSTTPYIAADPTNLELLYSPSGTSHYVAVVDDPQVIFELFQEEGTDMAITDVGMNCPIVAESGDTTTGLSTVTMDYSDLAVTSTDEVKVLRLINSEDNALGSYARFEVLINNHTYGQGLGSLGYD